MTAIDDTNVFVDILIIIFFFGRILFHVRFSFRQETSPTDGGTQNKDEIQIQGSTSEAQIISC